MIFKMSAIAASGYGNDNFVNCAVTYGILWALIASHFKHQTLSTPISEEKYVDKNEIPT